MHKKSNKLKSISLIDDKQCRFIIKSVPFPLTLKAYFSVRKYVNESGVHITWDEAMLTGTGHSQRAAMNDFFCELLDHILMMISQRLRQRASGVELIRWNACSRYIDMRAIEQQ